MDDQGINKYLLDTYGTTPEGMPWFRLIWTTGVTEKRFSEFHDYYGDIFIRAVREVREVLKYPFAQDRWVIERIRPISQAAIEAGLRTNDKFAYEEVYIFQDKQGKFLPLSKNIVEAAIFLYFKFFVQQSFKERVDYRMKKLAEKHLESKKKTRELIGDGRSPFAFVGE